MISDGESLSPARVGIDVPALAGYLDKAVGGLAGPLSVALTSGGRSNLTYLATDGHQHWVVRRPPLGHVLATAHDMTREAVVMSALAGTDVPVPEVVACCPDDGVIGAPFCVMRRVDGIVLRTDDDLDDLDRLDLTPAPPARSASTLSTCSPGCRVDPYAAGLGDFGRPDGYLERQVRRWGKQRDASHSREIAGLVELGDRLGKAVPESPAATIVHGDDRLRFYKLAVILEGIHCRHVHGLTVGGGDYDYIGPMVPTLVERGLAAAG